MLFGLVLIFYSLSKTPIQNHDVLNAMVEVSSFFNRLNCSDLRSCAFRQNLEEIPQDARLHSKELFHPHSGNVTKIRTELLPSNIIIMHLDRRCSKVTKHHRFWYWYHLVIHVNKVNFDINGTPSSVCTHKKGQNKIVM